MSGLRVVAVLIVWFWLVQAVAHAQPTGEDAEYASTIRDALVEYEAARYAEARTLFLRAHELRPSARTLRGLGLVEYELRHYVAAIHYLTAANSDTRNPLSEKQKQELQELLVYAKRFVGRYQIELQPGTAALMVDGRPIAREEPQLLMLDVGEHTLTVNAPGYEGQTRRLDVQGREQESLRFVLQLVPAVASEMVPRTEPTPRAEQTQPPVTRETSLFSRRTTWGWVSVGGAALAMAGTAVAWGVREAAAARWNDDARCLRDGKSRQENCSGDEHTANVARTWTIVGLVTTGALALTGALLLLPQGQTEHRISARTVQCGPGPGQLGAACTLEF